MPALSDYVTGTISIDNGSAAFTGTGTGWELAGFKEGDLILDVAGASGRVGVIASITSNTAGTLTKPWEGPTLTGVAYRMRFQADGARVAAQARNLIELLGSRGFFQYDASGPLAQRSLFDAERQGFSFLDTSTDPMGLYVKASNTSGDWAGPSSYATGPKGDTGRPGVSSGLAYTFSSTVADGDPGLGTFRANSAEPGSITKLWIDNVDAAGATV